MRVHPYYIGKAENNENNLINLLCPLSKHELTLVNNLTRRVNLILDPFAKVLNCVMKDTNNFRVIIDAEQSYIQDAIFSLS